MLENPDHCSPSIVGEIADGRSSIDVRDITSMSVDELWTLRESIDAILAAKISAELDDLSRQLARLSPKAHVDEHSSLKRLKATVKKHRSDRAALPKYQNPMSPSETWEGRGRRPLWLIKQLTSGKPLEDFRIA